MKTLVEYNNNGTQITLKEMLEQAGLSYKDTIKELAKNGIKCNMSTLSMAINGYGDEYNKIRTGVISILLPTNTPPTYKKPLKTSLNSLQSDAVIVKQLLIDIPSTRNNDNLLFLEYLKFINYDINKPIFNILDDKLITISKSVLRARRKVQELYKELKTQKIADFRLENETNFIEFSQDKGI